MAGRATFESIRTDDSALFVVKIGGHLGTRERPAIESLVNKCRQLGKKKVVFDFSGLESMGGTVAAVLGDFATELAGSGHPPYFIGASSVVQSFLTARFLHVSPTFAVDLDEARERLARPPQRLAKERPVNEGLARARRDDSASGSWPKQIGPPASDERLPTEDSELDDHDPLAALEVYLDDLSAREPAEPWPDEEPTSERLEQPSTGEPSPSATAFGAPPSPADAQQEVSGAEGPGAPEEPTDSAAPPPSESQGPPEVEPEPSVDPALDGAVNRTAYMTVADAQPLLARAGELKAAKSILDSLLHGAGLAEHCYLFCTEGDQLIEVGGDPTQKPDWLPAEGVIADMLRRRGGPIDLVDLGELDLNEREQRVLARLNCQLAVPVFDHEKLEGAFFVTKEQAGDEFGSSEELALDLLARHVGHALHSEQPRQEGDESPTERKLRHRLRRHRSILGLAAELHTIETEEQLIGRLLVRLIGEMGVASAVFFDIEASTLQPKHVYGMGEKNVEPLALADAQRLIELRELIHPEEAETAVWGDAAKRLRKLGFDLLVPLQGPSSLLGLLALAVRRSKETGNFDPEFLSTLLGQAGIAIEHVRTIRRLEDQTFRVTRTLIGLVERRIGKGQMASTELVTFYTGRLAEALNYEEGRRRDLLYGTVLRDVGMIEISDLVLRSPRTLSPEEWKLIQRHPISGSELLRAMEFSQSTCDVVLHHHERFNGQGYPEGLRGAAIPLGARMVSVVESFVAMTRETPYRAALSKDEALAVLQENWQMRYDPVVVDAFLPIARDVSPQDEDLTVERLLVG